MKPTDRLVNDAHPLRGKNRITYGDAVNKYGRRLVHAAMSRGRVFLFEAGEGHSFDPKFATPEMTLYANGVCVG